MQEDKSQLVNFAMHSGISLGLFWIFKYFFVIASARIPALSLISSFLSIGTPLILFSFLVKYKVLILNNKIGYWHGVQFGVMLFFFASIMESMLVFIHVTWIEPEFVGRVYENALEAVKSLNMSSAMLNSLENQPTPTNINYVFSNVILADVFLGLVLSLIIVPFAIRFIPKSPNVNPQS